MTIQESSAEQREQPLYTLHDMFLLLRKEFPIDLLGKLTELAGYKHPENIYGIAKDASEAERRNIFDALPSNAFEVAVAREYEQHMQALKDGAIPTEDLAFLVSYVNGELEKCAKQIEDRAAKEELRAVNGEPSELASYGGGTDLAQKFQDLKRKRLILDETGHIRVVPIQVYEHTV